MSNKAADFEKSPVTPGHLGWETAVAIVLALVPIVAVAILLVMSDDRDRAGEAVLPLESSLQSEGPVLAREPAPLVGEAATFDYEEAAALSAARWQAMAEYYAANGLLTRDLSGAGAVDPADRKFLDGSYRSGLPGVPGQADGTNAISGAVDPADRKFLDGSYRSGLPGVPGQADGTNAISGAVDPADRKFLDGSYRLWLPEVVQEAEEEADAYYTEKYWRAAEQERASRRR